MLILGNVVVGCRRCVWRTIGMIQLIHKVLEKEGIDCAPFGGWELWDVECCN